MYLEYLNNCVLDRAYPPLRLYENDSFIFINAADNHQVSISKNHLEVNINGVKYTDKDEVIALLDAEILCVNQSASAGVGSIHGGIFSTFNIYENEKVNEKVIDGEFHGSGHFWQVGRYDKYSFYLNQNKATATKSTSIRFGIYDSTFNLLREGVFPIDDTTAEDTLYTMPFDEIIVEQPQLYYVVFGRNDTLGGSFDIKSPRIDSNGTLNIDALFKFNHPTGNLPSDIGGMRSLTNRIFYSLIIGG